MGIIEMFFAELDARWVLDGSEPLRLRIIGSAALMLQTQYERGTKDSDIIRTADLTESSERKLLALAGEGTRMHRRHRRYGCAYNEPAQDPVPRS